MVNSPSHPANGRPLMATCPNPRPQNWKRHRAEADFSQNALPSKKFKSTREYHSAANFPPAFYDSLSKVWLTRRALRELDRRNQLKSSGRAPVRKPLRQSSNRKDIQRFARHGGPELSDLRGYPEPTDINLAHTMSSIRFTQSRQSESLKPPSNSTSENSNTEIVARKISAYDKNFEQFLINENVFPEGYEYPDDRPIPEPNNWQEMQEELARRRPSLSLSRFTNEDFRRFKRDNARVYEGSVMSTIFPTIRGKYTEIPHELNAPFKRLKSLTNETTTTAQPDFYDGANPGNIDKQVRNELGPFIIPTVHPRAPAVPNFFLEARTPKDAVDVTKRQATLDGALGARAMHELQSYGQDETVYDNNAYTLTSTYHDGQLKMYTTHITPPAGPGQLPEYHMTQYNTWGLTGNPATCRQGFTAFRNGREWAKKKRDQYISGANERARYAEPSTLESSHYNGVSEATDTCHVEKSQTSADELEKPEASPDE
ncbi:hypothetical protein LPUS_06491 [Lasallia pustulata]|uniref:Uncharacterized protein n=1 Tax=Lasallia pustulata TaxID=136370 RepID=A0A1W5D1C2_9LECA|nr:hypothetical protein LPUS_06491 [Lasallia pustulata]